MYKFKKGAAFRLAPSAFNGAVPFDVNPYEIEANLYDSCGNLIENILVEKTLENNKFLLKSNNTANWPLGYPSLEISFLLNGDSIFSEFSHFKLFRAEEM